MDRETLGSVVRRRCVPRDEQWSHPGHHPESREVFRSYLTTTSFIRWCPASAEGPDSRPYHRSRWCERPRFRSRNYPSVSKALAQKKVAIAPKKVAVATHKKAAVSNKKATVEAVTVCWYHYPPVCHPQLSLPPAVLASVLGSWPRLWCWL